MEGQLELWTEIIQESDSISDPLFLEYLESGNNSHLFAQISDDDLKSILGIVNKLLNDPKSRSRGMAVLEKLLTQINTSRFISFQDSITSAFHMITKDIDSSGTCNVLAKIIPICKQLSDVNQTITSTVIPKILLYICNDSADSEPSVEDMQLLKICLEKYHGPCGNYRSQLEKRLLHFIDHSTVNINDAVPLLSCAGGGGTKGDKHGTNWQEMVIKICHSAYDTLYSLYSDACPVLEEDNPFGKDIKLNVPDIKEQKVFLRISLLKNRLIKLCDLLAAFLRNPFSAPKPVPMKSILRLISNILILNPVDLLKKSQFSTPKEFYFLANILPSIHEASFRLLSNLIISVGTNLLPDASRIEQLMLQEMKWMDLQPKSFENLKIEMYRALFMWMKVTQNSVTTPKCATAIADFVVKDVEIEKETVKLNLTAAAGKSKHNRNKKSDFAPNVATTSTIASHAPKRPEVSSLALDLIVRLIPCLDHPNFIKLYQSIAKTVVCMTQRSSLPTPYDNINCRLNLYNCVLALAINPHPQAASSLSLLTNLVRQGVNDPVSVVSSACNQILSILERLIHPICPSMDFITVSLPATIIGSTLETISATADMGEDVTQENQTEMFEASCQTDLAIEPPQQSSSSSINSSVASTPLFSTPVASFDRIELKRLIAEAIRENIGEASTPRPQPPNYVNARDANIAVRPISFTSPNKKMFPPSPTLPVSSAVQENEALRMNGKGEGEGKRKCDNEVHSDHEEQQLTTKRQKITITTEDSAEVEEMLSSFVDIGCNEN